MPPPIRISDIPDDAKPLMAQLMVEDLLPIHVLIGGVENYRRVIHKAAAAGGNANSVVGDEIAHALTQLLDRVNEKTGADNMRLIQAAVRYFVIQDDGSGHDLESREGLYDDAHVVNAVVRYFGRDDLVVRSLPQSSGNTNFPH